jgi:hypothetical protein
MEMPQRYIAALPLILIFFGILVIYRCSLLLAGVLSEKLLVASYLAMNLIATTADNIVVRGHAPHRAGYG